MRAAPECYEKDSMVRPLSLRFSTLALVALVCAVLAPVPALGFDAGKVAPETVDQLTGGSPLVIVEENSDGSLKLVTGGVRIDASPQEVWDVVTDYASYPNWMPEVTECEVTKDNGRIKEIRYRILFKLSIITKKIDYTLRKAEVPIQRIDWELVDGDFDHGIGSWQMVPIQGGESTLVYYSTFNNLRSMGRLVRGLMEEQPALEMAIQVSTAVTVVKALRDRVTSKNADGGEATP